VVSDVGSTVLTYESASLAWRRLSRAAIVSLIVHLAAGIAMLVVLRHGLETNPNLDDRLRFLTEHKAWWIAAWLVWNAAALSILYFFVSFASAHARENRAQTALLQLAVLMATAGIAADLSAEAIEMGVLPRLAYEALGDRGERGFAAAHSNFHAWHRAAVMLTGYLANGLYTLAAILITWTTRRSYPAWTWLAGLVVGAAGLSLSAAALSDSAAGMLWSNVVLVPAILTWQLGVALAAAERARASPV
jgi:hypothetical protein